MKKFEYKCIEIEFNWDTNDFSDKLNEVEQQWELVSVSPSPKRMDDEDIMFCTFKREVEEQKQKEELEVSKIIPDHIVNQLKEDCPIVLTDSNNWLGISERVDWSVNLLTTAVEQRILQPDKVQRIGALAPRDFSIVLYDKSKTSQEDLSEDMEQLCIKFIRQFKNV